MTGWCVRSVTLRAGETSQYRRRVDRTGAAFPHPWILVERVARTIAQRRAQKGLTEEIEQAEREVSTMRREIERGPVFN